jgi:phytoene dehydrogenase-like protein
LNDHYDAIVVGAGPNGLAAAITLAQAKCSVLLVEARSRPGGSCVSEELTLPGFIHDTCSAIHPLAVASPFFRSLPLERHGLKWIQPELPLAHPLDDGKCALLHRSLVAQTQEFEDKNWQRAIGPFVADWENLLAEILQPILHVPKHPLLMARFGRLALPSASSLALHRFKSEDARSLFAGLAAHSFLDLDAPGSSAIGLTLAVLAHAVGWPMPEGGAGKITSALAAYFQSLGGKILMDHNVTNIDELPPSCAVFLDLTPRQVLRVAGHRLPPRYCRKLENFRYGPGVFKLDYALSSPVPWRNSNCSRAGTVHLGGTLPEIVEAEKSVACGKMPPRPFILFAQHTLFDKTRAPQGRHTAWAYCHIPYASGIDATDLIEAQIERFAPGFKDCVMARCARGPKQLEQYNANLVGGDINGGSANLWQLLARPVLSPCPYQTPLKNLFICSASTPPGGGVHGMSGYNAARFFLNRNDSIGSGASA